MLCIDRPPYKNCLIQESDVYLHARCHCLRCLTTRGRLARRVQPEVREFRRRVFVVRHLPKSVWRFQDGAAFGPATGEPLPRRFGSAARGDELTSMSLLHDPSSTRGSRGGDSPTSVANRRRAPRGLLYPERSVGGGLRFWLIAQLSVLTASGPKTCHDRRPHSRHQTGSRLGPFGALFTQGAPGRPGAGNPQKRRDSRGDRLACATTEGIRRRSERP